MPLIQAPQTTPISPSSGLITDPTATNISPPEVIKRLNPSAIPYLKFGGTLHGAHGRGAQLITIKSDKEIAAVNATKLQKFKDGLISQGYREIAPNVFSKRTNPKDKRNREYDVVNINPQTGDVVSNILSEKEVDLFQLQNTLDTINWDRASTSTQNRLKRIANNWGYTIDKGKIIPRGYYVTNSGKVKPKTGGWFGTPEAMAMIQRAQNPALFDYTIKRLQDKGNVVELTSKGWRVTPIRDIINMNLATERANQRKQDSINIANQQLNNIFAQSLFSQDKMNLITGNIDTALKDKLFGKWNWG